MASSFEKYQRRRLVIGYFSVVFSVFLVLFLLGSLSVFVVNSKKLSDGFKEEIAMTVFIKDQANDSILKSFGEDLKKCSFIKTDTFVSKDEAAKMHKEDIGEDFMEFTGFNPLKNSFDIYFKADFMESDSIQKIESIFKTNPFVSDVVYDKNLVVLVNKNVEKISFWILIITGFLSFIAILLINSTMRLSIYSNRFTIKTMQMVGATKAFIRRPFIWQSIKLGAFGAILAIFAILGILVSIDNHFPAIGVFQEPMNTVLVLAGVFVLGIFISWFSTFFATQRFLNLKTDDLY